MPTLPVTYCCIINDLVASKEDHFVISLILGVRIGVGAGLDWVILFPLIASVAITQQYSLAAWLVCRIKMDHIWCFGRKG